MAPTVPAVAAFVAMAAAGAVSAEPHYVIVAGIGGEPQYAESFETHARSLADAARRTVASEEQITLLTGDDATLESLQGAFDGLAGLDPADTLVVFLIGHGSYDGEHYKFNIKGPDPTGADLAEWFAGVPARAQLIVNMTSASGAVLEPWAAEGRTLITATRSGNERNATRFAEHFAAALSSDEADVDKNGAVSVQEAFDFAARKTADSYEAENALATEHPQLAGDTAARLTVARLAPRPSQTPRLAELSARMADIEGELEALRLRRRDMAQDSYLDELQALLLQLAVVQQEMDQAEAEAGLTNGAGAGSQADSAGAETQGNNAGARTQAETDAGAQTQAETDAEAQGVAAPPSEEGEPGEPETQQLDRGNADEGTERLY